MNKKVTIYLSLILLSFFGVKTLQAQTTYCTPSYGGWTTTTGTMQIVGISGFAGSSLNDTLPSYTAALQDRTAAVPTLDLRQGDSYTCDLTYFASESNVSNQVWIDFNDDGVFDTTTEAVTLVFPTSGVTSYVPGASGTINIPLTATPGTHTMRIRNEWYYIAYSPSIPSTNLNPCDDGDATNKYYSGTTADYKVNILALDTCSGTPNCGHLVGPDKICPNTDFQLTDTSLLRYSQLSFHWQRRPEGGSAWTDMTGTQGIITTSITGNTDFRVYAICNACSMACVDTSYVLTVKAKEFYKCYCALSTTHVDIGGDTTYTIDTVSISGTTFHNATHAVLPGAYAQYPDTLNTTATLNRGGVYHLYVGYAGMGKSHGMAWIDYDHSQYFNDTSMEYIPVSTSLSDFGYVSFKVPTTARLGKTGLRIRNTTSSASSGAACSRFGTGEVEDYVVTIASQPDTDLGATDIIAPSQNSFTCANIVMPVNATIYNFGSETLSDFYVYATYSGPATGTIYTKEITPLDPGNSATINIGTINPPIAGLYHLKIYTVYGGDNIHMNDTAVSIFNIIASPAKPTVYSDTVCSGEDAVIHVKPSTNDLHWYEQTNGGSYIYIDTSMRLYRITSDTMFYVATYDAGTGCESAREPISAAVGAPPVVNLGPDATICESPTFTLDAGNPGAKYMWNTGDTTEKIHVRTSGTYSVTVFHYCSSSDAITMTVKPLPSATGVDYVRAGHTYSFKPSGAMNANSYLWMFGDGDTSTLENPIHTYTTSVLYTVKLILYNDCGTDTVNWQIPTGIYNISNEQNTIKVFPNPAHNSITISAMQGVEVKDVTIINSVGVVVYRGQLNNNKASIDVNSLPTGHYILRANTTKGYFSRLVEVTH